MQTVKSYMKDSGDFIGKINLQNIPEGAVNLGYSGWVGFYSSIPHKVGLNALREALDNR